jgi:hypothetical protein
MIFLQEFYKNNLYFYLANQADLFSGYYIVKEVYLFENKINSRRFYGGAYADCLGQPFL